MSYIIVINEINLGPTIIEKNNKNFSKEIVGKSHELTLNIKNQKNIYYYAIANQIGYKLSMVCKNQYYWMINYLDTNPQYMTIDLYFSDKTDMLKFKLSI